MHISRTSFIYMVIIALAVMGGVSLYHYYFSQPGGTGQVASTTSPESSTSPPSAPGIGSSSQTTASKPAAPSPKPSAPSIGAAQTVAGMEVMAWIYPGDPTCGAKKEYSDGRTIAILKPEYFMVEESGNLKLLTEEESGCNGYSAQNLASIKKYSKEQYATVSSSYAGSMEAFLDSSLSDPSNIDTLVSFVKDNGLTGIEIDFEDFGGWTDQSYSKYKQFVSKLGSALHQSGKKLMVDGPATSNQTEENWFKWRYADFADLPVDKMVIMAYDYQYDQGVGEPISPLAWIQNTIQWTLSKYPYRSKLSVGIPSYGYKGVEGSQKFSLLTYEQIKKEAGFDTATVDAGSNEMTWKNGSYIYFYQTPASINRKIKAVKDLGVNSVSIWHLGGNMWFN